MKPKLIILALALSGCSSTPCIVVAKYNCEAYGAEPAQYVLITATKNNGVVKYKENFVDRTTWEAAVVDRQGL